MEENLDRLEAIVAKSNLVATAGEFVPKYQSTLEHIGYEQYDNMCNMPHHSSNQIGLYNQGVLNNYSEPDGAIAGSSRSMDFNLPHSSGQSNERNFNNGSRGSFKRNDVFFADNRDQRFSKFYQNKPNHRWKKPETGNSRNRSGYFQDYNSVEVSQNKFYNKVRPKEKFSENYTPNLDKSKTHHRNNNSYKNMSEIENLSWRRKDRSNEVEYNPNQYTKNKYKQYEGEGENGKRSSYKYENRKKDSLNGMRNSKEEVNDSEDSVSGKTSQREHLINLLTRGVLECLVCCEPIYQTAPVWSCSNCYHVLHLKCTIKWAKSSKSDFGWRCPACQNVSANVPDDYFCFCGKLKNPEWNHQDCPHSCGDICEKTHKKSCPHKCTLLCHPGPCPQCTATVVKHCGCGRTSKTIQCCSSEVIVCDNICEKELNCLIHGCQKKCHVDACEECKEVMPQECYCKKEHRDVKCSIEAVGVKNYSCGNICGKQLSCGNHFCDMVCHEGDCPKCSKTPDLVKFCPCGKTELSSLGIEERKSCCDPIPTCDLICEKNLMCSVPGNPHTCQKKCHEGSCPSCPLETLVKCRCGHMKKTVPCSELNTRAGNVRCEKRCSKKRSCGKHKCNQMCCIEVSHECPLPCGRLLQCGLHRCEETCHRGQCKPCLQASFEELLCECGAEVIFPPVPCGTRRPHCERPCTRTHTCEHPPTHNCHSANECPPCTVLTKKYCHGRHELRRAVPCFQESFSCGLPCGKEIECGRHKCILSCHPGPCLKENQPCVQPCTVPRPVCGHTCGTPCHDGACPTDVPCKEMVRVTCECGHRYTTRACYDNAKEYQRIATARLATKMADLKAGQSIDLNDVVSNKLSYKTLECNDECKLIERNRRLAIALQIRNPDLSAKLTPRYSEYLKNWAKKDARFCQMVHDKLTDLVQLAKQSKQKSRSYSFDPMNREKRHFIHEYCEHFGCESVAYDQEPKRNVVATALKDKSWLPSMSIIEFIQKENSPRKVPVPVMAKTAPSTSQRTMEVLPSKILSNHQSNSGEGTSNSPNDSQIDYFDWRPQNF